MVVLNGGSYYPNSIEIDEQWISDINKDDLVAFVPAATTRSEEAYFEFFKDKMSAYSLSNIECIDLYNDWTKAYKAKVIYIAGGNTYKLMDILIKSKFDNFLKEYRKTNIIVGNSAGAVVMGKDIRSANSCDIIGLKNTNGLGLVNYSICPHYTNDKEQRLNELANNLKHKILGIPEESGFVADSFEKNINFIKVISPS
jgi:dipeptidase E